jgi:hypothetical protein
MMIIFDSFFLKVLDIIRNNYDTLALKLHDDLDQYDSYSEKASEASFFANIVSIISNHIPLFYHESTGQDRQNRVRQTIIRKAQVIFKRNSTICSVLRTF